MQHSLDRFLHRVFTVLDGGRKQLADERGVRPVWISLSHTEHHAVATIGLEGMASVSSR
jgi:phosphopantetheinyl transferase (holo-ACP synthase)